MIYLKGKKKKKKENRKKMFTVKDLQYWFMLT